MITFHSSMMRSDTGFPRFRRGSPLLSIYRSHLKVQNLDLVQCCTRQPPDRQPATRRFASDGIFNYHANCLLPLPLLPFAAKRLLALFLFSQISCCETTVAHL